MTTSRRTFLSTSAAALAAAAVLPRIGRANWDEKQPAQQGQGGGALRILILGGTGFLGPACTEAALARGHKVTHFNRGRSEQRRKDAGRPSVVPEGVEELFGNRDPNKTADDWKDDQRQNPKGEARDPNSPKGLSQLEGKKWDAVIDTSGYWPRIVKASAELLAPNVKQYVFISTLSVYKDNSKPRAEDGELGVLSDPNTEDFGADFSNYGPGKAASEAAAEKAMPGRVTNIRPGFIVGPRDTSGRFMYWPVRASLGGEMSVPGSPEDPIQVIDVRDLAEWVIHCIEGNITGVYNATGPETPHSMKRFVEGCIAGTGAGATPVWIDNEFVEAHGVAGRWPLYVPPTGEGAGFHRCNVSRAVANGLKFRPIDDTAKATLEWYRSLPTELQARMAPQLGTPPGGGKPWMDQEKELLAAWKSKQK